MSDSHFKEAREVIAGGVNSPVRAFKAVGGTPVFFERGSGAYLYDVDGRSYIDYVGSWGPMILGHAHPEVIARVREVMANGLSFGAPTTIETALAKKICELIPAIDKVRMVNSGTEAAMSAIRLARGFTGRDKIIKFEGCYHGHTDALLVKAGSGALTLGIPTSPGVPADTAKHTITLDFNDTDQVLAVFENAGEEIAAVIVEPVAGNMNCIPGSQNFLDTLRQVCDRYGSILIFDEVMTGFRVALGGAQALYDITPRPHPAGQGHRRRHAGRRFRWAPADYGPAGAGRPRVPGRDFIGQPGGNGCRPGDAGPYLCSRLLYRPVEQSGRFTGRAETSGGGKRRVRFHQSGRGHVRAFFYGRCSGYLIQTGNGM